MLIIAILLIFTIGYLSLTSGLCMVRGVARALNGRPNFLLAIIFSGSFTWIVLLTSFLFTQPTASIPVQITLFSALGGFLFGFGSAINHGCGISTISRLARGEIIMLATLLGWLIGWLGFATYIPDLMAKETIHHQLFQIIFLISLSLVLVVIIYKMNTSNQKIWATTLSIGIMAGLLFMIEPNWTPSQFLRDTSLSWLYQDKQLLPSISRLILLITLVLAMIIAALKTKAFALRFNTPKPYIKHLLSGILMGLGAVFASGGNDSQLLLGLPALSPASIVTVVFIVIGIACGLELPKQILLSLSKTK